MALSNEITCYTSESSMVSTVEASNAKGEARNEPILILLPPNGRPPLDQPQTHQKSTVQFLSLAENSSFVSASSPSRTSLITFRISLVRTLWSLHLPSQQTFAQY